MFVRFAQLTSFRIAIEPRKRGPISGWLKAGKAVTPHAAAWGPVRRRPKGARRLFATRCVSFGRVAPSILIPNIETARLLLEPVTTAHASELTELFSDPLLHTYVPLEPPTYEQQLARCTRWQRGQAPDKSEIWLNWAAREKSSAHLIAHFQASVRPNGEATIGYVVIRNAQGKGFAFEAMTAVIDLLKDRYKAIEVKAWTDTRNVASHKLAAKLGMSVTAIIQNADSFKGSTSHEFVFSKRI